MLNATGIATDLVDYVVDRNVHKHGRFMPGTHQPIVDPRVLVDDPPDVLLLLAWNFAAEIIEQQSEYAVQGWAIHRPRPVPGADLMSADPTGRTSPPVDGPPTVRSNGPARLCGATTLTVFFEEGNVPTNSCLLLDDPAEASGLPPWRARDRVLRHVRLRHQHGVHAGAGRVLAALRGDPGLLAAIHGLRRKSSPSDGWPTTTSRTAPCSRSGVARASSSSRWRRPVPGTASASIPVCTRNGSTIRTRPTSNGSPTSTTSGTPISTPMS